MELLPGGGGLHDGGVDTELVPGAEDGHLHVPVARPPQLCHGLAQLGVGSAGINHFVPGKKKSNSIIPKMYIRIVFRTR